MSELGIKNGSIIHAEENIEDIKYCIPLSTAYILEDKNKKEGKKEEKKEEIKYIAVKFIKNGEVFKFICKTNEKFKEISLKFMKQTGEIKQYNFYFNGKLIFDENKTLFELNLGSFIYSEIIVIVTDVLKLINFHNKNKIEKKKNMI